jgi:hypothetical protein
VKAADVKKAKGKGKRAPSFSCVQFLRTTSVFEEECTGTRFAWKACGVNAC